MQYYSYIYQDTIKQEPFYVGKGQGKRSHAHLKRVKDNPHFSNRIKKMLRENNQPDIKVIPVSNESEAFELEKFLIYIIGRRDIGTGTLCNMTDGGENPPLHTGENHPTKKESARQKLREYNTPEVRARKAEQMKGKRNALGNKLSMEHCKIISEKIKIRNIGNKYAIGNKNAVGYWINNGNINKKIKLGEKIPNEFVKGRLINWIKRDPQTGRLV